MMDHNMFYRSNMENYPSIIPFTPSYLEHWYPFYVAKMLPNFNSCLLIIQSFFSVFFTSVLRELLLTLLHSARPKLQRVFGRSELIGLI